MALRFIVLLGLVSMFSDMTYQGARSIAGQYLGTLGANVAAVGVIAGFGELVAYGLRLLSGYLTDRTRRYWAIALTGYLINLLAVPLLALAGHWVVAAALLVLERVGKAIRTPARDVMIAHATREVGRGKGFGLHHALDQLGAVCGPLAITLALSWGASYQGGFALLLVPAGIGLAVLLRARLLFPHPQAFERQQEPEQAGGLGRHFWLYLAAAALMAAGSIDFPLIGLSFQRAGLFPVALISLCYAVAMAVDGLAGLGFGRLFDRFGLAVLIVVALVGALVGPLLFAGGRLPVVGVVLWGLVLGAQGAVLRAAVAQLIPSNRRGTAYGTFNSVYGLAWFAGSAAMGALYQYVAPQALVAFSSVAQLAAIPLLAVVWRETQAKRRSES